MGIKKFEELLVDDTGFTEEEIESAENFNRELKEKIIDELIEYESEQYIKMAKTDALPKIYELMIKMSEKWYWWKDKKLLRL